MRKLWDALRLFALNCAVRLQERKARQTFDEMSGDWRPERRTYRDDGTL